VRRGRVGASFVGSSWCRGGVRERARRSSGPAAAARASAGRPRASAGASTAGAAPAAAAKRDSASTGYNARPGRTDAISRRANRPRRGARSSGWQRAGSDAAARRSLRHLGGQTHSAARPRREPLPRARPRSRLRRGGGACRAGPRTTDLPRSVPPRRRVRRHGCRLLLPGCARVALRADAGGCVPSARAGE